MPQARAIQMKKVLPQKKIIQFCQHNPDETILKDYRQEAKHFTALILCCACNIIGTEMWGRRRRL